MRDFGKRERDIRGGAGRQTDRRADRLKGLPCAWGIGEIKKNVEDVRKSVARHLASCAARCLSETGPKLIYSRTIINVNLSEITQANTHTQTQRVKIEWKLIFWLSSEYTSWSQSQAACQSSSRHSPKKVADKYLTNTQIQIQIHTDTDTDSDTDTYKATATATAMTMPRGVADCKDSQQSQEQKSLNDGFACYAKCLKIELSPITGYS